MGKKNKQILFAAIGTVLMSLCVGYAHNSFSFPIQIFLLFLIPFISCLFFVGISHNKIKLYKMSILIVYFSLIILVFATLIVKSGIMNEVKTVNDIIKLIQSYGAMGKLVFVAIQFLQVTFIPIPSTIVTAAGAAIYPPWEALLLSTIGLLIGSLLAFAMGKTFGVRLVKWIVGEESLNKYYKFVKGKDKAMLIYMFIFPAFPDDVLCLFAGLTSMGYVSFIIIQLISRPLNVAFTVFFVDAVTSIPLTAFGIVIYILLALLFIASMIFMWKYAAKIEFLMLRSIGKLVGKPLIKDIDLIVAEDFKSEKFQNITKNYFIRKKEEEEKLAALAALNLDNENAINAENILDAEILISEGESESKDDVFDEQKLQGIADEIIKKANKPMNF